MVIRRTVVIMAVILVLFFCMPAYAGSVEGTAQKGSATKSSTGSIGAFAQNWYWSRDRKQDGVCAETKIDIDLPENFTKATLVLKTQHSQYNGNSTADVYICDGQQLEPDDNHNKGSWWLSNAGMMGKHAGTIRTKNTLSSETLDVTDIVREYPCKTYYIAVRNNSDADIGIPEIYIEIEK